MTRRRLVFWGATGQARVLRECLGDTDHQLVALFDNNPNTKSPWPDVPLLGGDRAFADWLADAVPSDYAFMVAIGGDKGRVRLQIHDRLKEAGLVPISATHPRAFIANNARVGEGCQVLVHASVCVDAVLGRSCIVNTAASLDHECRLGHGVHLAPGARLAGCVEVGDFAMVGTGATVLPRIRIGKGAMVGAGAVVTRDVPENAVVVGIPARVTKIKDENE